MAISLNLLQNHRLISRLFIFVCLFGILGCQQVVEEMDTSATLSANVSTPSTPLILPEGLTASPLITDLSRPTQFIEGPDGRLWIAQLFAGESDEQGQVIAVDLNSGEQSILLSDLNKPTGIAVLDNALWIAEESQLLRADLNDDLLPQQPEVVLTGMPNNGRSNGTLTVSPDGMLIYETSGRRQGNLASEGSGILWALDPLQPDIPTVLATGLKNAYAHVFDENGRLWITEIGDGRVVGDDFEGQPPEELNLVTTGADFGWPDCFGNQAPALNREGTLEACGQTRAPVTLFPSQSTPTSLVVSPWGEDVLLVALWLSGEVTAVSVTPNDDNATGSNETFISGFDNPQHMLVLDDGVLLVSDYRNGTIYKIVRR